MASEAAQLLPPLYIIGGLGLTVAGVLIANCKDARDLNRRLDHKPPRRRRQR